jgi:hypothetical protein
MGSTNFLPFNPSKTNMVNDATYLSSDYRVNGARTGIAPSAIHNKIFYQSSMFVAAYAKVIANKGFDVTDYDFDTLVSVISDALGTHTPTLQRQVFTTSGTFTVPAGVSQVFLSGCAAGAGGAGIWGASGGAGESVMLFPVTVSPGEVITVTIGVGGNGGLGFSGTYDHSAYPVTTARGTDGTNTIFGSHKTLISGKAPVVTVDTAYSGLAGGLGGTRGNLASISNMSSATVVKGGDVLRTGGVGGDSLFGVGGRGGVNEGAANGTTLTRTNGENGQGYGSGGGGGAEDFKDATSNYITSNGGNGANGLIIVEWFI